MVWEPEISYDAKHNKSICVTGSAKTFHDLVHIFRILKYT